MTADSYEDVAAGKNDPIPALARCPANWAPMTPAPNTATFSIFCDINYP